MTDRFATVFLFLLLALHKSENSLFSRFRNPNEFVAPDHMMAPEPGEIDANMYSDLLDEIPELRSRARWPATAPRDPLRMPYLKNDFDQSEEDDFMINSADVDDNFSDGTMSTATATATVRSTWDAWNASSETPAPTAAADNDTAIASNGSNADARRWGWFNKYFQFYWRGPRMATCYVCNVHHGHRVIPVSPICHDAWDSPDWQARTLARYFRGHCYQNKYHWGVRIEPKTPIKYYNYLHRYDRGLFRGYYGQYVGGCYKRFLDVGKVYTARGCRTAYPYGGGGFAAHRFRKLEMLLKGQQEACIVSPHASLTPFSRAVSLYVRYHVCVCKGKYCNKARPLTATPTMAPLLSSLYIYIIS